MKLSNWLSELKSAPAHRRSRLASRLASAIAVEPLEARVLLSATTRELFFSVSSSPTTTLPGVGTVGGADIVRYDGTEFSLFFDGSDVGLGSADIRGFAFKSENELLMSFAAPVQIDGVGTVNPWQVVLFTATSLGEATGGTFSFFFDIRAAGVALDPLSPTASHIDALEFLSDGSLLVSTLGRVTVTGATGEPITAFSEDVLRFTFPPIDTSGPGEWSLYFDGSDVGLGQLQAVVDGLAVSPDGNLFLSTLGTFSLPGNISGDNQDVIEFVPTNLGADTSGTFLQPLFFDGSEVTSALLGRNVDAIAIGRLLSTNSPPVADSQELTTDEDVSLTIQLTGDDGDPNREQTLAFEIISGPLHGTLVGFDSATGQVTYIPHANYNGTDSFTFAVYEVNADGSVGLVSEPATVSITINAVNDAPTNTVPGDQVGNEDVPLLIEGIAVHDVDVHEGDGRAQVTLSVASGTLTVDPALLVSGTVSGNGSGTVVLTGLLDEINAVLSKGVTYLGRLDFHGTDTLVVLTSDLGNSGAGGVLTARSEIAIHVRSPQQQAQDLAESLEDLADAGVISGGTATALTSKLQFTNATSGAGKVGAFVNQVNALVRSGRLSEEDAQALLDAAEAMLQSLETTAPAPRGRNATASTLDQAFVEYDLLAQEIGASNSRKKK